MSRSEKRARTHLIGVRVTPDELAHASRLAVRDGLTVSGLFRSKVLDMIQPARGICAWLAVEPESGWEGIKGQRGRS